MRAPSPPGLGPIFGGYIAVVVGASYLYVRGSATAWYAGLPSLAVFGTTVLASLLVLMGIGLFLTSAARRPGAAPMDAGDLLARATAIEARLNRAGRPREASAEDVEAFLDALASTDDPEQWPSDPREAPKSGEVDALRAEIEALKTALAALKAGAPRVNPRPRPNLPPLRTMLGPTVTALMFLAVSAFMLPGIDYFVRVQYVLSNMLVLAFAFGLPGLAGYTLASMLAFPGDATLRASEHRTGAGSTVPGKPPGSRAKA